MRLFEAPSARPVKQVNKAPDIPFTRRVGAMDFTPRFVRRAQSGLRGVEPGKRLHESFAC